MCSTLAVPTVVEGVPTTKAVASTQSIFELGSSVHYSEIEAFGLSCDSYGRIVNGHSYFLSFLSTEQWDLLVFPPRPVVLAP